MTRSSGRYVSVVVVTVECHIHTRPPSLCFRIICNSRRCSKTQEQEIRGNVTLALITAVSLDSSSWCCFPVPRARDSPSLLRSFLPSSIRQRFVGGSEQSGECNQATRNRKRERNKGEKKAERRGRSKKRKKGKKGKVVYGEKKRHFLDDYHSPLFLCVCVNVRGDGPRRRWCRKKPNQTKEIRSQEYTPTHASCISPAVHGAGPRYSSKLDQYIAYVEVVMSRESLLLVPVYNNARTSKGGQRRAKL